MKVNAKRILIVDDKRLFRAALATELERAGHDVTIADDGAEALTQMRHADVIVLDLDMRSLDCVKLLEGLNLDNRLPQGAMVAITDASDAGVACRLHGLGVARVLTRWQLSMADIGSIVGNASRPLAA